MNDYEDLRAMIPPEKQHIKYKANLLIFSYFRQERSEYKEVNILQQYFHVDS